MIGMNYRAAVVMSLLAVGVALGIANAATSDLSFDELLLCTQRRGSTVEKRTQAAEARQEFLDRGASSLEYLMGKIHIENLWIRVLAQQLALKMETSNAVPILINAAASPEEKTRKYAVYFLGFHEAPEHAERIVHLLDDNKAAASTVRTLGKWRVTNATMRIVGFLDDPEERRRVMAANALRDMGDARAVPALVRALSDPVFTVRKCAARALVGLGLPAESAILAALPAAADPARREMVRILGGMPSPQAREALTRILALDELLVGEDARRALEQIDARAADGVVGEDSRSE